MSETERVTLPSSGYIAVGLIGSSPGSSVYHTLIEESAREIENDSGFNLKALCNTANDVRLRCYDTSKVDLSNWSYCKECRSEIGKCKKLAKRLRMHGKNPGEGYWESSFTEAERSFSLTTLAIQRGELIRAGKWDYGKTTSQERDFDV